MRFLLHRTAIAVASLWLSITASSMAYSNGWQGWPCPTNVDWSSVSSNHYFFQLYTAMVERCVAVNQTFTPIVDTGVSLYNGYTNNVVTTNGLTVTNKVIQYKTVSLTNQFLPFTYTYSNAVVSGTEIYNPPMRRSWFTKWDDELFRIAAYYVNSNQLGTDGTFNAWFAMPANSNNVNANFPVFASTNLLDAASVGWTNRTVAHWTYSATVSPSDWMLASIHSSGSNPTSWTFKAWNGLSSMHPANNSSCPVAQYVPGGTNSFSSITMTLSGTAWETNGNNSVSASEVLTFSSTNDVVSTNAWRTVTSISCSSLRPNSNDAVRITYITTPSLYDVDVGWKLTPASLNERKSCVDKMLWSYVSSARGYTQSNVQQSWSSGITNRSTTSYGLLWTQEMNAAEAGWPGPQSGAPGSEYWPTNTSVLVGSFGWSHWDDFGFYVTLEAALHTVDWSITNAPPTNATASASCEYYSFASRYAEGGIAGYKLAQVVFADIDGVGLRARYFTRIGSSVESAGSRTMGTTIEHDTTTPAWCNMPDINYPLITPFHAAYGYEIRGSPLVLYKWDGPNGFKYK